MVEIADPELFEWELRIARRADVLARTVLSLPSRNLECWLRAEREFFAARYLPTQRPKR
ncbi:MAG: hypothetical protein JWM35_2096 [Verrucomicrobia bacterium]|nr:hypothetical protein [Verrucomicrobiota bacterium]